MKKITFITPAHQLYDFSTDKVRTVFRSGDYLFSVRRGKYSVEMAMMTRCVRWEEHLQLSHSIVHLREDLSEEQKEILGMLGNFSPVEEFTILGKSPRHFRDADIYALKKLKSRYELAKESAEKDLLGTPRSEQ